MDTLTETVNTLLLRDAAPARSVSALCEILDRSGPGASPEPERLLEVLIAAPSSPPTLVRRPKRRWSRRLDPPAWVVAGGSAPASPNGFGRCLARRMRWSLRSLASAVDAGSAQAWARWNRLVEEEARSRRFVSPRRRGRPGRLPSTTRPRDPRPCE